MGEKGRKAGRKDGRKDGMQAGRQEGLGRVPVMAECLCSSHP